jgi:hypothetical protein
MFSDRTWIKAVMFGKSAIRMLSPQLNAQADSIDNISALQQQPRQEIHQQPSQQPEARRGLATINVWGDRFIIRHTGNQKYL